MVGGLSSGPENISCENAERFNAKSESTNFLSDSSTPELDLFLMGNGGLAKRVGASAWLESEGINSNHAKIPSRLICARKLWPKEPITIASA